VVVVGGGHNGLTCAAYLARADLAVLVVERRAELGGACTLERPFADERFVTSPCAYLVGLLHPLVIAELDLLARGLQTFPVDPTQWTPFEDGTALFQWRDEAKTARAVAEISRDDVEGFLAYDALFARIRDRLRAGPRGDVWLGDAPDRGEIEELFADDGEARDVVLHASIADVVERHVRDERLRAALHGQGVIGTFAGPRDPGTAWIHAHHTLGLIGGWSFVEGGIGRVSLLIADAARDAGAVIAAGLPVAAITPGEGVALDDGTVIRADMVVSNADPVRTLDLLRAGGLRAGGLRAGGLRAGGLRAGGLQAGGLPAGGALDAGGAGGADFADAVGHWRITSPVVKLNCALARLPTFPAAGGDPTVFRAQVEIARGIDQTQDSYESARRGEPAPEWCELYFQTAYDASVAPAGHHTMSVFAQFVPYELARGTWDTRRDEIADATIAAIARFAPDVADCVVDRQVLGPPDVERRIGLTGGHIFQGECLPEQMWDRRFASRTPVAGLYLCGAATHPGGSVMGVNGRNAAAAVLTDRDKRR
jgi:phytoene dehydrogenase-like protein